MKCGMTQVWDTWGRKRVCTVLQVDDCAVTQVKRAEDNADGRSVHTVQVGGGAIKAKGVSKPLLGHFRKADVSPKRSLAEFRVSEDALPPVGAELTARHFRPGQRVDLQGTSKGKMFAGVMKRWNFKGESSSCARGGAWRRAALLVCSAHITSHHISSHHITSHHITSQAAPRPTARPSFTAGLDRSDSVRRRGACGRERRWLGAWETRRGAW